MASSLPRTLFFGKFFRARQRGKRLAATLDTLIPKPLTAIAPGCVVLIAKKRTRHLQKAFGVSDLESGIPVEPGMIFRIGSITKPFTAIAILQLIEQGKISLQDNIQKYITDYPHKQYTVRIENLLTQTPGIKDYMAISKPATIKRIIRRPGSRPF